MSPGLEPRIQVCFFCHQPLKGDCNKHHTYPKRYGTPKEKRLIVRVHCECHRQFHRLHDNPNWNRSEYLERMEMVGYGYGIFAAAG